MLHVWTFGLRRERRRRGEGYILYVLSIFLILFKFKKKYISLEVKRRGGRRGRLESPNM